MNVHSPVAGRPVILSFCRNYLVESFRRNAAPLASDFDFEFLTDGICPGAPDTREAFYAALAAGARSDELTAADEVDVTARCRLLRNIDPDMATRLAHAMAVALGRAFDRVRPSAVLSQMVDEYSSHIFALLAAKRGIGYVGFCAGYFPGRSLLLADAYGRPFNWREADDAEVEETLERISPRSFRQNYNLRADYRWSRHVFLTARYQVKRLVFALRAWRERDPWNLHYAVLPYVAERRHLGDYPRAGYFAADWETALAGERARRPAAPVVYMPLSYFPESTIDYWVPNRRAIAYNAMILEIVRTLARDCIVVVKEHLHMMGARRADFLRALKAEPGTVSVHPRELSNAVVEASDAVLLGSGSPGLEATVRGKPVFSFCDTSYWYGPSGADPVDLDRVADWPAQIRARLAGFTPPGPDAQRRFIQGCLRSSTHVDPASGIWPIMRAGELKAVFRTAILRARAATPAS